MTRFLGACRFLMVIPVMGCVLLTAGVFLVGIGRIVLAGAKFVRGADLSEKVSKMISVTVIEIIDLFLLGTVAYITAVGLYKLFISDADVQLPIRLKIRSLMDLEGKITGVIAVALGVAFLGQAVGTSEPETLLHYGAGIALVIAAMGIFMYLAGKQGSEDD